MNRLLINFKKMNNHTHSLRPTSYLKDEFTKGEFTKGECTKGECTKGECTKDSFTKKIPSNILKNTSSTQIIKNSDINECIKCIYYNGPKQDSLSMRCTKYGTKNIITGKIFYDYAEACRKDETKCGYEGKSYEKIF